MKLFRVFLVVLVLVLNLVMAFPTWAKTPSLGNNADDFQVGQKVIWLYKARADFNEIHKIPAEVVKLSNKQVQIKVRKNNEFINRWVNPNKLEKFPTLQEKVQTLAGDFIN
ncbi:hypothetical protein F7734_11070 [Scytonema sp. UIC 10036]|uniref:hypothetical protein n=1 Tax=Scytonema sp. UIC 10036 TaxID=2304196 RepID=UPI0012DA80EE|nr:hypothetical protein [Scytonema sp. UIC 10036]MUG92948.1 hypothetical protein [Scytonema sp. UIC 10036]